jgi:hypothetical protein
MSTNAEEFHAEIARLDEGEDREEVLSRVAELLDDDPGLVNKPAPPEFPYSPLFTAVMVRDEELVELLLSRGADWQARATIEATAESAPCGDSRAAGRDQTLLHTAVAVNHPALVELFLQKGIDVNSRDGDGCTPLFVAASSGDGGEVCRETIELLLRHGADIHATIGAETLMDRAAEGNLTLVELLEQRGVALPLMAALRLRRIDRVRAILRDHPEQISRGPDGRPGVCEQTVLFLQELTLTPVNRRDPSRMREEAARSRQVLRDHLDILEGVLQRVAGEGFPAPAILTQAVQMVGPEVAELLLRYGVPPGGALETNMLLFAAGQNPFCAAELKDLLARYGIRPRPDAPPLHQPPVLFANIPRRADSPKDQPDPGPVVVSPGWPGPAGDPVSRSGEDLEDYLARIRQALGEALRQADPNGSSPHGASCDDTSGPEPTEEPD